MPSCDLLLRGGTVVDGTGSPGRRAEVAARDGVIAAVGEDLPARREIDCSGLVVAPGFIDTHSHSDLKVLSDPFLPMKLRQGITLEVLGQDGLSVAPLRPEQREDARRTLAGLLGEVPDEVWRWQRVADYLDALEEARPALNLAYLAPHGMLRTYAADMDGMLEELRRALDEGAIGLSTGLIYPPCCYADTEELIALGVVLARMDAPFVAHMRNESHRIERAVDEMIEIGRKSGCRVHISHFKIAGRANFGRAEALIERLQKAQADVEITGDQYPYAAGSTMLGAILPPWVHEGGATKALDRLAEPDTRRRIRAELESPEPSWESFWHWTGPEGIVISDIPSGRHGEILGRSLAEAAGASDREPVDFALDLLREERMGVAMISHSQSQDLVDRFARLPFLNGSTDALLGGRPHPRAYGTFPRFLSRYVREKEVLSLPEMIRKLTGQAARAMRLDGVGEIRPGLAADLVVFDPERVRDTASFAEPMSYPEGIVHVVVSGRLAVENGELTGVRAGRVIRRKNSLP